MGAELKSASELGYMRDAGRIVKEILVELRKAVAPGVSTFELDRLAEDLIHKKGAAPAFKGYRGFPCVLCASVNEEVVHGIPSKKRVLKEGDLMKLDFGVVYRGYFGDSAVTVPVGKVTPEAERLIAATHESLEAGLAQVREGNRVSDIGVAVQKRAEASGYSVVRKFVGHGIGRAAEWRLKGSSEKIQDYIDCRVPAGERVWVCACETGHPRNMAMAEGVVLTSRGKPRN